MAVFNFGNRTLEILNINPFIDPNVKDITNNYLD